MATATASIPAPVIEPVLLSVSSFTVRVTRVPGSITVAGYRLYRATDSGAWAKVEGADFTACTPTLSQPATSAPFATVTLTSQPTSGTVYYRARAEDNLSSATQLSPWSNVIVVLEANNARRAVPAWPVDIQPGVGALAGVVASFQDYDADAGITWHDARTVMARVAEQVYDELANTMSEGAVLGIFLNPPPALRHWFEYAVAEEIVYRAGMPTEKTNEWGTRLRAKAERWWAEMFDDGGKFILPGAGAATTGGVRVSR